MATVRELVENIEKACLESNVVDHPNFLSWFDELKYRVVDSIPEMTTMTVGTVYRFTGKKGAQCRAICTKENTKTWVLYETADSSRPGCRWMIGKGWCTKENIQRDTVQSWKVPAGTKFK